MDQFLDTPLGKVRIPEPLIHGPEVMHVIINPRVDRIDVQLLGTADDGLVVVASATLSRSVAKRFIQAFVAGLEGAGSNPTTMIMA